MEALLAYVVEQKALESLDIPWFPLTNPSIGILAADLEIVATVGGFAGCHEK